MKRCTERNARNDCMVGRWVGFARAQLYPYDLGTCSELNRFPNLTLKDVALTLDSHWPGVSSQDIDNALSWPLSWEKYEPVE